MPAIITAEDNERDAVKVSAKLPTAIISGDIIFGG